MKVVRLPLTGTFLKTCRLCNVAKPRNEFNRHPSGPDGLDRRCKPCQYAARKLMEKNPKPKPPKRDPSDEEVARQCRRTIVDDADDVLRQEGWSEKRIAVTALDTRMREANRLLHARGADQLGKKDAWLIK